MAVAWHFVCHGWYCSIGVGENGIDVSGGVMSCCRLANICTVYLVVAYTTVGSARWVYNSATRSWGATI